jgi:hypothetical protein
LAGCVGDGGVTDIGGGAQLRMSTICSDVVVSDLYDISDVPFDAEVNVNDTEYQSIMDRTGIAGGGEPGTRVSAFNSSI